MGRDGEDCSLSRQTHRPKRGELLRHGDGERRRFPITGIGNPLPIGRDTPSPVARGTAGEPETRIRPGMAGDRHRGTGEGTRRPAAPVYT